MWYIFFKLKKNKKVLYKLIGISPNVFLQLKTKYVCVCVYLGVVWPEGVWPGPPEPEQENYYLWGK